MKQYEIYTHAISTSSKNVASYIAFATQRYPIFW